MATRAVTMDFQNRLGIASLNDANGATAIYINGPGVSVRNFSNIKSNETAFVVGPNGDGAVIENGSSIDPGSINLERVLWLANGADSVTVRRVEMGSTWSGGGNPIMVAPGSVINDLTLDRIRMYDPDTEGYWGMNTGNGSVMNRMRIIGSTFEGFQSGYFLFDLRGTIFTDLVISGNTFKRNNISTGQAIIWFTRPATNSVISRNTFTNDAASQAGWAVYASSLGLAATQNSGWRIEDNYFDGMRNSSVYVGDGSGIMPVARNTFGPLSYGGGAAASETNANALVNNVSASSNQGIVTWYPTSATIDAVNCELDVAVTPPVSGSIPGVPVRVDVYYTAATQAEIYLGGADGLSSATTVSVPYTLGPGNIRVQTTAANGATSQHSRVVAQNAADACGPRVTVDQAAGQADPTSVRDVLFTARFSEAVTDAPTVEEFSTAGSTAPGVSVTGVSRVSGSEFAVTARANGSGQIVLSLPAGAVVDPAGNPSVASTSTDNVVMFVSPLSVVPASVSVTEGGPAYPYTVTSSLAATSPLTITPTVAEASWATVAPGSLSIATTQSSGVFQVTAVQDTVVNATRATAVSHTVSSADLNFDGLILPDVAVQVLDDDQPDAGLSSLVVSAGTRKADGVEAHTATATIRNAAGVPVSGVLVTFQVPGGVTASALSCVTVAGGVCSVSMTSTLAASHAVRAFVNMVEVGGSPASVAFVAGPWDPATTTITASVATLPADSESSSVITVTLFDSFGNRVTSSAGPATWGVTGGGTLSEETDNGDGTYTARLTAPTTVGAAVVSAVIGGQSTRSVTVNFIPGQASPAHSAISADPESIKADGVSESDVTVELRDAYDNDVLGTGDVVTMDKTAGTLSPVTPLGDGDYGAVLTAPTTAGIARISFTVNGSDLSPDTADVVLEPGDPDAGKSQITADPTSLKADGVSKSAVRVVLFDVNGNRIHTGGATVGIVPDLGSLSAVVDQGDGSYLALLTAPSAPGTATLTAKVGADTLTQTATVNFIVGEADPNSSLIVADPTTVVLDGDATSTLTVTVRDMKGNVLTAGGSDVNFTPSLGTVGPVTDNLDGTYTATLTPGTVAGNALVKFSVNGQESSNSATVVLLPGPADAGQSLVTADPPSVVADNVAASKITVTLKDKFGNVRPPVGDVVDISSDLGTRGSVLNNGDGTYSAFLASKAAGVATVSFQVNGEAGVAGTTVTFVAGDADLVTSTIVADPVSIEANGSSTSKVTVRLLDQFGNPRTTSGGLVEITSDVGDVSLTVDLGDGTYTADLKSETKAGVATVGFTIDTEAAVNKATVTFAPGSPHAAMSTIVANPTSIDADGASESTVTVQLIDQNGNPLTASIADVKIDSTAGTTGDTTNNGDGAFTAKLRSSTAVETATAFFTVGGARFDKEATVDFVVGRADVGKSTISASLTSIIANGESTSTATVRLLDQFGNPLTKSDGRPVEITSDVGTYGATTDNGDGTYTATLTSTTLAQVATLSFTLDGVFGPNTTTVAFVPGRADLEKSTIEADPATIFADEESLSTVTVRLIDKFGNPLTGPDPAVVMIDRDAGTISPTTDNGDGTYTATLRSDRTAGVATVSFTLDKAPGANKATVTFVAGAAVAEMSTMTVDKASMKADGTSAATATVQLRDKFGNPLSESNGTVHIDSSLGDITSTTDNSDGTYTATLTSPGLVGVATLSFTFEGNAGGNQATVTLTAGDADPATSTITVDQTSMKADGASTATVTVQLKDKFGNALDRSDGTVQIKSSLEGITSTTDNSNGTYTATLTSPQTVGVTTLSFTLDGDAGGNEATVTFVAGDASVDTSTIEATPTTIFAGGGDQSTVIVRLKDKFGNPLTASGGTVEIKSSVEGITLTTDNNDGTYTATLTSPVTAGVATLSFTLAGDSGVNTATVTFVAGTADPGQSTITADEASITADKKSTSKVTVQLRDQFGNPLTASDGVVEIKRSLGEISGTTDNNDGTYTATLTSATTVGVATLSFTIEAAAASNTTTVAFVAGPPSPEMSTITADPTSIIADGASQSKVTVTLLDEFGNRATTTKIVEIETDGGDIEGTTNNGDGTYTAMLTSPKVVGVGSAQFTVDDEFFDNDAKVTFVAGPASVDTSTITASPTSIIANESDTSTVTVRLLDQFGNALTKSDLETVTIKSSVGTYGATTDNGDGTYTAVVTSGRVAQEATLSFTIGEDAGANEAKLAFVAGPADPKTSTITADPTSIFADGASFSTVTVRLLDQFGNPLTASAPEGVTITSSTATHGTTTDNGDGTYTAKVTSTTVVEEATVSFTVGAAAGTKEATVAFTAGTADLNASTITAVPTSIFADGTSFSTVTVQLKDVLGHPLTASGGVVEILSTSGSRSATTDLGDGTYTATLTSPTTVGQATLSFTLGTERSPNEATVAFVHGPAVAARSTISATPAVIFADGKAESVVTVTLFDAQGNRVTSGGATVTLSPTAGTPSLVTDVGDGTYTATLRAGTVPATASIRFGVNGVPGTATTTVQFVVGLPDISTSTITAAPASVIADGKSESTVTVTLRDATGNLVTDAGAIVAMSKTAGTLGAVTDHGDGTYSAQLIAPQVAGSATLNFRVAGEPSPNSAVVTFRPGAPSLGTSTITASPTVLKANGAEISTVTVRLVDAFGNPLIASGGTVLVTSDVGNISPTTNNNDGTYTAQLTALTVVGKANLGFRIEGEAAADTEVVSFVPGPPDVGRSLLDAAPALLTADGVGEATVTLTLLDAFGNRVTTGGRTVTMQSTIERLSLATDHGDGTYTAVLTAPNTTAVASATITATLDGPNVTDTATVAFVAGTPVAQTSTIEASPTSLIADPANTSAVTVTVRDGLGNLVTNAGGVVTLTSTLGDFGSITNNGDGTYSATLTSGTKAGTATVRFAINNSASANTATVEFTPGSAVAANSTIVASPGSVAANGEASSAITVTLFDQHGNRLQVGGDTVTLNPSLGTLGPMTDLGNGSYKATLTSPNTPGQATVTFAVSGVGGGPSATVDFVAGAPDRSTSTIVAVPPAIEAGSGASTITVTLLDIVGNPAVGSAGVTITSTLGEVSGVTMLGDGTATATLTSAAVGTATVRFTINGANALATAAVVVVDTIAPGPPVITGPSDGAKVRPDVQISGEGEPGATVVVSSETGVVCTTVVGSDGRWSCFPIAPLPETDVTLTAQQTDAAGNTSEASPAIPVTVDGMPPVPPVLNPTDGGSVTGTAEPGSTVTVSGPDGAVVCTAVTAADGTFECIPTEPLPEGMLLSVTATDEAGNVSMPVLVRVGGPRITLGLLLASVGQAQTARGLAFLPDEPVTGLMESTPIDLGLQLADTGGITTFASVLAAGIEPGTHRITLTGAQSGSAWAEFEVPAPDGPSGTSPGANPALPRTGVELGWLMRGAALLLSVGGFLLILRRRIDGRPTEATDTGESL